MYDVKHCSPTNLNFLQLVAKLDAFLAVTDGEEHSFYDQFNSPSTLDTAVLLWKDEVAIGCGGFRIKSADTVEVKRMFIEEAHRGSGAAAQLLIFLEDTARKQGFKKVCLETGVRQKAAVNFYERSGYARIENYPPYEEMENSVCYEKRLNQ